MTKRILVTGGAGFIGSAVIRQAIRERYQIVNVDALTYAANSDNIMAETQSPLYRFEHADIRDRAALDQIFNKYQPDWVIHLAAESHVDRSIDAPAAFIETNVLGTFQLLQAARSFWNRTGNPASFRFLHISTDEVFGSLGETGCFTETTAYDPHSPYSASKASSDHLVRSWGRTYNLPVIVSNCSNNYGPCQFPEKLIPTIISCALTGKPIPIYGSGNNVRDWLFVEDHAEALLKIIADGELNQTYNIGGGTEVRNIDIALKICRLLDQRFPQNAPHDQLIQLVKDRPGHDFRYAIDATKIQNDLGWTPKTNLAKGLALTVDWYLANFERFDGDSINQRQGLPA